MQAENIFFEEKQYMGLNKTSLMGRMVLALFCFIAYYWSENPKPVNVSGIQIGAYPVGEVEQSGQIFFVMGLTILILSVVLLFVLHIRTLVTANFVLLDGLWTARRVKIDLQSIVKAEKVPYSRYLLNRPVYNLHHKGIILFFTSGNQAIELTDRDGLCYRIGSQQPDALLMAIQQGLQLRAEKNNTPV